VCVQTWQNTGFTKDVWLEAVNPHRPAEVCVAQITQVRGRLLWLRLEGTDECVCMCVCVDGPLLCPHPPSLLPLSTGVAKLESECLVDVESTDIFPVGWCEANAYPLTPPLKPVCTYTHTRTHTHTHTHTHTQPNAALFYRPKAEAGCGGTAGETVRRDIYHVTVPLRPSY